MLEFKEKLETFGKLERFEAADDKFHIKITEGFSIKANNTFNCMKLITETLEQYPLVDKFKTEENLFDLILKQK